MSQMLSQARHLVHQREMLAALGGAAADAVRHRFKHGKIAAFPVPGPEISLRVAAPSASLIDDFVRQVAGDPALDSGQVPPMLFPQWGLPAALRALRGSGFPVVKILNGGCRLEVNAPLARGRDLTVRARLASVRSDERRSVLCQRIVTAQDGVDALIAEVHGIIRSPRKDGAGAKPKAHEAEPVPTSARLLEEWSLARDAGLTFALLTGDVNPLHWLSPYARLMGFAGTILHGFAAMARAYAGLERAFSPRRLRLLDVRFVRPLLLPAQVSLYSEGERVFVGSKGAPPYLTGSFATA